jgi:hypothetical protein
MLKLVGVLIELARNGRREHFLFLAGSAGVEDAEGLWQRLRRRLGFN